LAQIDSQRKALERRPAQVRAGGRSTLPWEPVASSQPLRGGWPAQNRQERSRNQLRAVALGPKKWLSLTRAIAWSASSHSPSFATSSSVSHAQAAITQLTPRGWAASLAPLSPRPW